LNTRRIVTRRLARSAALSAVVLTCTILTAGAAAAASAGNSPATLNPALVPAAMPAGGPAAGMLGGLSGVAGLGGMTGVGGVTGLGSMTGLGSATGTGTGASSLPATGNLTNGLRGVTNGQRLANLANRSGISGRKAARLLTRARHIAHMSRQRVLASASRTHAALANAVRGVMRGQAGQLLPGLGSAASAIPR